MKLGALSLALAASLFTTVALAQTPTPTPTVTAVEPFPSPPNWLRAHPGPFEDSWYVYGSGFMPRTRWVLVEAMCPTTPCDGRGVAASEVVKEDGTISFYMRLPRAEDPSAARLLAAMQEPIPAGGIPGDAPFTFVAGHNPGPAGRLELDRYGGYGYPAGTRTGIGAVDEIIALGQSRDTAALRSRLVMKDGTTTTGTAVRGLATWQCQPYVLAEQNLDQGFEYPSGLVYAVFRVTNAAALPLRYHGATYGIAWYDGGTGIPLGGLTLVSASGQVVGTEIRCGTTPGYHVHDFGDWVLAPFDAPAPTVVPAPPSVGTGVEDESSSGDGLALAALVIGLLGLAATLALVRSRR